MPTIEIREKEDGYHWSFATHTARCQSVRGYKEPEQAARLGRAFLGALVRSQKFHDSQRDDHRANVMGEGGG